MTQDWLVYLLECADGTLYTGITNDLERRLEAHNAGEGAKYTRGRGPVRLIGVVDGFSRGDALREEMRIKRLTPLEKRQAVGAS